ncbi:hypothetical protein OJ997_04985 [Solirubrobacter phytolaccae]|uniref:Ig-like domain-containing protein n=1 Tax=Solirubrobacter phytolaccae TaxID=1404360 RepID=A0A9X3N533_9ACTN|nr:hypothetical protein [Solirubrobacter phytolaccae]MDA0179641.1 hypothetical protein [Solirubrobacter phytolaccae]
MKRLAITALTLLLAPAAAQAGTYDVVACNAAAGGTNNAWALETNDASHIEGFALCPSAGTRSGLLVTDRLTTAGAGGGSYGQWVIHSPAGTTITRIRLDRYLNMDGGTGWRLYGRQADGTTLAGETCTVQPGFDDCTVSGAIDRAVNTSSIAYGFDCPTGCITGATIHSASAAIYSATVTISDPTAPTVGAPSGALVGGGFHKGTESVTFNGVDALGLKARRLVIDEQTVAEEALACDYTRMVPCANPGAAVTLGVDLNALADGTHAVQVAVVDAAGNETRSNPATIVVDHTGPGAPALTVSARPADDPRFTVSWSSPGGQVAPIAMAHWRLCSPSGCTGGTTSGTSVSGTLAGYGTHTLHVALEDAAGNRGEEAVVALPHLAPAPPSPTPTATPTPTPVDPRLRVTTATLDRSARTLTTSGTAAGSGTVTVRVRYRVNDRQRSRTVKATLRGGRFSARVRLSRTDARRARSARVSVSYGGDAGHRAASVQRTVKLRR